MPNRKPPPCANAGFAGTACSGSGSGNHNGHSGGSGGGGSGGSGSSGRGGSGGGKGDCGTTGLSIVTNLPNCRIYVVNQAPGDGTVEHLTITNTSSSTYTLSLEATGTQTPLWSDLEMGVWQKGSPAPTPLPPLGFWATQFTQLTTLAPNQVVHYTIELYLPATVGNSAQHEKAVIDFSWRAES